MTDPYENLLPRPISARQAPGTFELTRETGLAGAGPAVEAVRLVLAPLRLPLPPSATADRALRVHVDATLPGGPEAYRVRIDESGVDLVGSTVDGVRHAAQTLRQLLPDAAFRSAPPPGTRWIVPCGEVSDAPALAWRGGMLDVS